MNTNQFKPIAGAENYQINKRGDIMNKAGYPVTAVNGKVRLTIAGDRKFFTVAELVKDNFGTELPDLNFEPIIPETVVPTTPAAAEVPAKEEPKAPRAEKAVKAPKAPVAPKDPNAVKKSNKLNWEIVRDIRKRVAAGEKRKEVAASYGIHESSIWDIVTKLTWKNDPEDAAAKTE